MCILVVIFMLHFVFIIDIERYIKLVMDAIILGIALVRML